LTLGTLLLAITMGMDVFAGGLALGVNGLQKSRWATTAAIFAFLTFLLTTLGVLFGRLLDDRMGTHAAYIAGAVLIVVGLEAIVDTVLSKKDPGDFLENIELNDIIKTGIMVTLDKLAVGISLAFVDVPLTGLVAYLIVQSFVVTLLGLMLGKKLGASIGKAAKVLAGGIFVVLGLLIILDAHGSHNYI
jgi:manganese efflux pump family protein